MSRPDFLIIGAMKCGTTTLQEQLAAQPGIFMTTPKEPNFFSDDAVYAKGADWYGALFDAAKPGDIRGEASTHYTKLPTHPETIARMQPMLTTPKFIYMIRNPVARAMSHYIHSWSKGEISGDPAEALAAHSELVDYGRYGWQIAPFIDTFGAGSVFLTSLEQLTADPQAELHRIGVFLDLPTPPIWQSDLGARNSSAERFRPLPMSALLVNNPLARFVRHTLVPKSLRAKIRHARAIRTHPELPAPVRARFETVFKSDLAQLQQLFPGHPALTLCYPFATP
jgi:hypothetical protein